MSTAGTVRLVAMAAVLALGACTSSSTGIATTTNATSFTSTTGTSTPGTSTPGTSTTGTSATGTSTISTTVRDDGCDTVLPSTSLPGEGHATQMTIAPWPGPLTYRVEAEPPAACPGAQVTLTVHAHNTSDEPQEAGISLVIGSIPHIVLGAVGPFSVPAGGDGSAQLVITVPLLAPGEYTFGLVGGMSADNTVASGSLTVERPAGGERVELPTTRNCMSEVWAVSADATLGIGVVFDVSEQSTTGPTALPLSPIRFTVVHGILPVEQLCAGTGSPPPSGLSVVSGSGTLTLDPPGAFPGHGVLTTAELVLSDGTVIAPIHVDATCLGCLPS